MTELANWVNQNNVIENNIYTEESEEDKQNRNLLEKLQNLKKENSDLIGWLKIKNTNIDYPVVQTTDNDYYVNHSFKKEYSKLGTIFLIKIVVLQKQPPTF